MWLVVGISGVTCSGKTSLTDRLLKVFPEAESKHQDMYFLPESSERHVMVPELNHFNWELLSSMDMEAMFRDVQTIIATPSTSTRILLVEGHTIFNYAPISDLCDVKFYVGLTREQCWARRRLRTYDPADVPGYFDQIVWPEAEKNRAEMLQRDADIRLLDGMLTQEELEETVVKVIRERLVAKQK